jgi:hypothetical protein
VVFARTRCKLLEIAGRCAFYVSGTTWNTVIGSITSPLYTEPHRYEFSSSSVLPAMSASPNDSLQLSERPLEKKLVSELLDIAKAMNIDTAKLHKPDILKAIKVHIQTHPGLADDPHLLPLVGHRTAPQALGKTSAGKATEEEIESSKPKEPATGYNSSSST